MLMFLLFTRFIQSITGHHINTRPDQSGQMAPSKFSLWFLKHYHWRWYMHSPTAGIGNLWPKCQIQPMESLLDTAHGCGALVAVALVGDKCWLWTLSPWHCEDEWWQQQDPSTHQPLTQGGLFQPTDWKCYLPLPYESGSLLRDHVFCIKGKNLDILDMKGKEALLKHY